MVNFRNIEIDIVSCVKDYLKCEVIQANQVSPIPPYPYVSYTVTTPMVANNGTYGEVIKEVDGKTIKTYCKEFQQVWSFTVQSDDDTQSKTLALALYDCLDKACSEELAEKEIVVQRIGNITSRDNLISIQYEHRNGFDVTFAFMNEIEAGETEEVIESVEIKMNDEYIPIEPDVPTEELPDANVRLY